VATFPGKLKEASIYSQVTCCERRVHIFERNISFLAKRKRDNCLLKEREMGPFST
jgi:hypothetical protein